MKTIALFAFACDPSLGSEPGNGWSWVSGLAQKGYQIHCFTRSSGKENIDKKPKIENVTFHYVTLPFGFEKLFASSTPGMYLYYIIWQYTAYRTCKHLSKKIIFDVAHHVTWGSTQMGSFIYKLGIPFIFGPAGGGQVAPEAFKKYFLNHWDAEVKREKVSKWLLKYNPACKKMLKEAQVVLSSNPDTMRMVQKAGAKNVVLSFDATVPNWFIPASHIRRNTERGKLKLLWVGRFMPRKGLLLVIEVMKALKDFPGITLSVVGDGEMKSAFLDKVEDYQLNDTVFWMGKVPYEDVIGYYKSHDAFIFTSLRDSGPAQLVEAMAYSLPIITINLHGQAILVSDQRGTKCDCETPEIAIDSLRNAVLELSEDPELLQQKSIGAFTFAKEQTWDKKIDSIVSNYYPI
ncbi:glycosyltransferase family 4 protein [Dyadobacter psychrotolerans]|nr:glycosyltransferase family 4 protein [Dyadobacter psychrotolerans]